MKTIMYYIPSGPDGNIEEKIQNWMNNRYRGDLMYSLTYFKENSIGVVFPHFKQYRSITRESWIPNLIDILKDKSKYDIVYAPYIAGLEDLIYLRGLRLYRKKIVVWQNILIEKGPRTFIGKCLNRIFLHGIDKFIFFDENSQTESLQSRLIPKNKTVVLNWGADLDLFNNILTETSGQLYTDIRFISTASNNRDF